MEDKRKRQYDPEMDLKFLKKAIDVSVSARKHGNPPFGALIVDGEGNLLMENECTNMTSHDCINHAETPLVSKASREYTEEFLWDCTLYSSCEPCPMCAGAIYWSNIGRVVYAMSEAQLLEMTGNHEVNPTMSITAEQVLGGGQKDIILIGPVEDAIPEALKAHEGFWSELVLK